MDNLVALQYKLPTLSYLAGFSSCPDGQTAHALTGMELASNARNVINDCCEARRGVCTTCL